LVHGFPSPQSLLALHPLQPGFGANVQSPPKQPSVVQASPSAQLAAPVHPEQPAITV
jgi:hypothetical protein